MSSFDCYITDLDGTLCDTMEANLAAYEQAFADNGLIFDKDTYVSNFGLRFDAMMEKLAPDATQTQRDDIAQCKAVHYKQQLDKVRINHQLVNTLRYVKSNGAKLGLATTARQVNAEAVLKHHDLWQLFDVLVYGEQVKHGKPDPECYQLAMRLLSAEPTSTMVFEDSDAGVATVEASGANVTRITL